MDDDKELNKSNFINVPVSVLTESKPILKHAKQYSNIPANYMPRRYKQFESEQPSDNDALKTIPSSESATRLNPETPVKFHPETTKERNETEGSHAVVCMSTYRASKPAKVINLSPKGKDVSPSICIDVAKFSPKTQPGSPKKNIEGNSESKLKALFIPPNISQSDENTLLDVDDTAGTNVTPKRGSRKRKQAFGNDSSHLISKQFQNSSLDIHTPDVDHESHGAKSFPPQNIANTPTTSKDSELVDESHRCNICNKVYSKLMKLQNHMNWHVKTKMFKCNVCKETFTGYSNFIRHQKLHNKNKKLQNNNRHVKNGKSPNGKMQGRKTGTHKCSYCSKSFTYLCKLQAHLLVHGKKFRCPVCSKGFAYLGALKQHTLRIHKISKINMQQVRIKGPRTNNISLHGTQSHSKFKHKNSTLQSKQICKGKLHMSTLNSQDIDNKINEYRCDICEKQFLSHTVFNNHKRLHTGEKPYKCPICNKCFLWLYQVNQHCEQDHKEPKPYKCDKCDSKFRLFTLLRRHKENHQDDMGLHKHDKCDQTFESPYGLRRNYTEHKKSSGGITPLLRQLRNSNTESADVPGNEEGLHKCDKCDRTFESPYGLRRHYAGHKKSSGGITPSLRQLRNSNTESADVPGNEEGLHKNTKEPNTDHSDSPPSNQSDSDSESEDEARNGDGFHKCKKCNRIFQLLSGMRRHCTVVHDNAKLNTKSRFPGINQSDSDTESEESDGSGSHKCAKCDQAFYSLSGLRRHITTVHRKPKPKKNSCTPCVKNQSSCSQGSPQKPEPKKDQSHENSKGINGSETETTSKKVEWIKLSKDDNDRQVFQCGLCTHSDRYFASVASVRKHVGMIHRDFTDILEEPRGLYGYLNTDDNSSQPSTSTASQNPSTSTNSGNNNCTCNGHGKSFVYKNNKLTHVPSSCPVHNKESSEPKKPPTLKCKHCEKEFDMSLRGKLEEHELSHELEATQPMGMMYACFECGEEFALASDLMDHHFEAH